jgi:4-amino-4-deoxy-L-arabinose transferase-like glycosyltransferase
MSGTRAAAPGPRTFPLAVFVLALALRCGFALAAGLSAAPPAWGDDPGYDAIARGLTGPAHVYDNTWFPPGYPLFLAVIYGVFGPSLAAVRIVQACLSAATCLVAYAIARDAFGKRAGQITGVLLALYPGHIYMAWRLMAETLFTLLLALAVLAAQRAVARDGPPAVARERGRRAWLAAGAGLALGVATLVKSNLIVLAPLLLLWLAFAMPRPGRRRAAALAAMAAMAAGCALPLLAAPLASRLSPAHRASWLPGNGGPTLWWSNNPLADGYFVDPDNTAAGRDFINRHGQAAAALKSRDPMVRDHADRDLALTWVHEHPGAFVRLVGQKLWNAFGPLPRTALFTRDAVAARVQAIAYGIVLPLVVAGLWQSRRRWREAMPLYLVLASYTAMTVVFYGTPRFTLLVMPFMLAFAGLALAGAAARSGLRPPFSARRARLAPLDAGALSAQGES